MKSRYYYGATLLFLILLISSCRSQNSESSEYITDSRANIGDASVVVNLLGSEFVDLDDNNPQASANKQLKKTEPAETYYTLTSPSTLLAAEVSVENSVPLKTSAGINPVAVTQGPPLDIGHKFRLIAYRASDNGFVDYKDFTVGTPSTNGGLRLPKDVIYRMVVYSYGTNSLPGLTGSEMSSFNAATHSYSSNGQNGFLYFEQPFRPVEGDNTIPAVILRHKIAQVTTKINSSALSGSNNITAVSPATLIGHNRIAVFNLSNASVQSRSAPVNVTTTFGSQNPSTEWTSNPVFINAASTSPTNKIISFSANVTIGGVTKPITVTNGFTIKPGFLTTYKINLKEVTCGALVNGIFREFECYNLGATQNGKPFTPSADIHGGKYQWNGKAMSQTKDQNSLNLFPNEAGFGTSNIPDGAYVGIICPPGYRLPTSEEWTSFGNSNTFIANTGSGTYDRGAIVRYNGKTTLFLPFAGSRKYDYEMSGQQGSKVFLNNSSRGSAGTYWSATGSANVSSTNNSHALSLGPSSMNPFGYTVSVTLANPRIMGASVRCIKKLPNE
ncbi:FISUMP domain-containing protein [Elizabethkingia ursingii]|uniref:Fibrobacter succinogenes major paralogous domain-containing protein n=1 Tax=Elizabethkingia ursingii TaxID=1756150 RepID=A0AAJ3NAH7_9FLAO|nr:FISUMP domain-containing protein [Elizabethkingia ursingii]AQX08160.1 hypothetical protein BBD34_05665 [Elizabethkingia ursingii]OPB73484.1 hypothetical protein BAY32_10555 [Elizabethkingia ursingii]